MYAKKMLRNGVFTLAAILATASSAEANMRLNEIEGRLRAYLENHLDPDQFMVAVTLKEGGPAGAAGARQPQSEGQPSESLPGLPGFSADPSQLPRYRAYFDLDGRLLGTGMGSDPVTVHVLLNSSVSPEKVRELRRMIPIIGRLNTANGDDIRVSTGRIQRSPATESEPGRAGSAQQSVQHNWIDSIMRFRQEFTSLALGLIAAIGAVVLLHGLLSVLRERAKKPGAGGSAGATVSGPGSVVMAGGASGRAARLPGDEERVADGEGEDAENETRRPVAPGREAAVQALIHDMNQASADHPERIAKLLTEWIQRGEVGAKNAAHFVSNLTMKARESVLNHMLPSDLQYLDGIVITDFEPTNEANVLALAQARQDLLKITASSLRQKDAYTRFAFLNQIEDETLVDLLKGETAQTAAYVATLVPGHRMAQYIKSLTDQSQNEFVQALGRIDAMPESERLRTIDAFRAKWDRSQTIGISEKSKVNAVASVLAQIHNPTRQRELLESLASVAPAVGKGVRDQIVMFEDVPLLQDRFLKMLVLDEDPVIVARAFSDADLDLKSRVVTLLPRAAAEIFDYEQQNISRYSKEEIEFSKHRLVARMTQLVQGRVISLDDVRVARVAKGQGENVAPKLKLASGQN
jgi:flagellar motor switch protein FliG